MLAFRLALQCLVYICPMRLIARADVYRFPQRLAVARLYGTTIHHDGRSIVPSEGHDYAWHIFVAPWDRDAGVVVLRACYGFDAIGDYLASLEGKAHA